MGLRQRNGDAEGDSILSATGLSQRCHTPGMVTLEIGCHLEPEKKRCFVTIPAPAAGTAIP